MNNGEQSEIEVSASDQHERIYGTTCAKPALFLDNLRACDGCPYIEICVCPLKKERFIDGKPARRQRKKKTK